jgi:hypothetical protein
VGDPGQGTHATISSSTTGPDLLGANLPNLAVTQLWLGAECVAALHWAVAEPKKRPLASS